MAAAAAAQIHDASGDEKLRPSNQDQITDARWRPALKLPCQLAVELPLPDFTVSHFLKLQPGIVISTGWRLSRDVPLRVNGTLIGWGEFEGAGKRLAVRLTELA